MMRTVPIAVAGGDLFHALATGAEDAPLLLLLHGFPDTPHSFEPLMEELAARGHHVVAPFLRGYHPSPLAGPYHLDQLAGDVIALADALSPRRRVTLVGHDWGAAAAYVALARAPERWTRAVTMAVPHPLAIVRNLRRHPSQLRRSWYMAFFQLRGLSDRAVARNDFAMIERLWRDWSPGYRASHALMARLKACLAASMPAPLAYYRALTRPPRGPRVIVTPTLHLHGADDGCISADMGAGQDRHFDGPFESRILSDLGHFLHAEDPDRVASAIGS